MPSQRMVAVVIAVADARPLTYLAAALNGARDFAAWAEAQGYDTTLITDEIEPLTVDRLRAKFEPVLASASNHPIQRLVVYFAGHGLVHEMADQLWLVSDWSTAARCIKVSLLKRHLFTYDIGQISIFSDACRLLPTTYQTAELTQDGVVGWGPRVRHPDEPTPPVDTFVAAQDYAGAFAIRGQTPADDRCIFTGVLMPGLWGARPEAFSKIQRDRVVSRSLATYAEAEVRSVAKRYGISMAPTLSPTFPEDQDVYYFTGATRGAPPTFPDWPPAEPVPPKPVADAADLRHRPLPAGRKPRRAEGRQVAGAVFNSPDRPKRTPPMRARRIQLPSLTDFHANCGFVVAGATVDAVWVPPNTRIEQEALKQAIVLKAAKGSVLNMPVSLLLELSNGHFGALCALPEFAASVLCTDDGIVALAYGHRYEPQTATASAVLTRLEAGALRPADIPDLAVHLRMLKHADPVLGAISAYLYDSIGDVGSIRRMAYFYIQHGQPIPYDVALLGQLQGYTKDGVLWAHVPGVPNRAPTSEEEKRYSWAYEETPDREGPVGGHWPWLRQGWPLLDDPTDLGSSLIDQAIRDMLPNLRPGRFATVDRSGALRLANAFGLRRRELRDEPPPSHNAPVWPPAGAGA